MPLTICRVVSYLTVATFVGANTPVIADVSADYPLTGQYIPRNNHIIIIIIIIIIKAICRAQDRPKATSALWQSAELSTVRMSTVLHITVKQKCMSSVVF